MRFGDGRSREMVGMDATGGQRRGGRGRREFGIQVSGALLAASLGWLARQERDDWQARSSGATTPTALPVIRDEPVATPAVDLARVAGVVEAMPDRTFRLVALNRWPILQIHVHEGQRISFQRKGGRFEGGNILVTQRETPAEIDLVHEQVEIAAIARRQEEARKELLLVESARQIDQAKTRVDNANKELDRLRALYQKSAGTEQEVRRAGNLAALAQSQLDELQQALKVKARLADLAIERSEHEFRRAQAEHDLADYKREFSWGRIPVTVGNLENVVVTKVHATRGAIANETGSRDVWIEVVDDSVVQIRAFVEGDQADALRAGAPARLTQGSRTFAGNILAISQEADRETGRVPVLVEVRNEGFRLRLNSRVSVDLARGPRG